MTLQRAATPCKVVDSGQRVASNPSRDTKLLWHFGIALRLCIQVCVCVCSGCGLVLICIWRLRSIYLFMGDGNCLRRDRWSLRVRYIQRHIPPIHVCVLVCVCVRACVPIVIVRAPPFVFLCHVRQRTEELPSTRTQLVLGLELATQLDPELAREIYKEKEREREGDSERDRTNLFCAAQVRHISRQSAQAQLQSQCQS